MVVNTSINIEQVWEALQSVQDPEIPVLSVIELGMITHVSVDNGVEIKMIPTYAACPAVNFIRNQIKTQIEAVLQCEVHVSIDPTINWDTNRITDAGKRKLESFGIASPKTIRQENEMEYLDGTTCPNCKSDNTILKTPFGSTLCRAIHFCKNCNMPFEHFKPLICS